ncbi:MAG: tyrosine--tRNA ligase [Pseudomonadota bacterium]|nr:tyrosine--tRNA ligase [Pseudomonadota bacterium]
MSSYKSEFIQTIVERGFVQDCSDIVALDELADNEVLSAYIGFDCTAPSLHAGSLLPIMLLRWLQNTGHKPIVLMGGGTTKVGDPSGKDESRLLLSSANISDNMAGIKEVFSKYLSFGKGDTQAIMADNAEWLDKLNYIDFLRDYGMHFTINRMLKFDSVKIRLDREQPLTFLEFNYMILQAYDFLELSRRYNCRMQMGGSDQWGNILNGLELARRVDQSHLFALTTPLLTSSSGSKMGKTASGAIWLDSRKTPVYDFWQYWRNTEDQDVGKFLRLFTELPIMEIEKLEQLQGAELNEAKKILATEVTTLCHTGEQARTAELAAQQTFEEGGSSSDLPFFEISIIKLNEGLAVSEALVLSGLTTSKSEGRRLIKSGGCKVNDVTVKNELQELRITDKTSDGMIKLSVGKKKHILAKPV